MGFSFRSVRVTMHSKCGLQTGSGMADSLRATPRQSFHTIRGPAGFERQLVTQGGDDVVGTGVAEGGDDVVGTGVAEGGDDVVGTGVAKGGVA